MGENLVMMTNVQPPRIMAILVGQDLQIFISTINDKFFIYYAIIPNNDT